MKKTAYYAYGADGHDEQLVFAKGDIIMRYDLGRNPNLDDRIQKLLAADIIEQVRYSLAGNIKLCKSAQLILAKDTSGWVKRKLGENVFLCDEAQIILAEDDFYWAIERPGEAVKKYMAMKKVLDK